MIRFPTRRAVLATGLALPAGLAMPAIARAQNKPTELTFLFPVAVGGPITKIIDGYAADFMRDNPDIRLRPVYAGSYTDTLTKALTSMKGGDAPHMAVLLSTDTHTLIDQGAIVSFDEIADSAEDRAWRAGFYPAFMANGTIGGHCWGIPFQRSTIVLYWNKAAFKEAGLDTEAPPAEWGQQTEFAAKLLKRDGMTTTRWGIQIPGTGFAYWMYQALATQAGVTLANPEGTQTTLTEPGNIAALQYWMDLSQKEKVHPPGVVDWATTPRDFIEGRVGMIWHTTGNLSNIRQNAKFPFGVAMLPAQQRRGSPTGGGNFHIFKTTDAAQRKAAYRFVQWATAPERAARWGIDTGYVAVRPDAWATPTMKAYTADFPQVAVARDQLQYAVAEFSTHDNQRVTKALDDRVQAALLGKATAEAALGDAQRGADRLLRSYR
jgi:sn-glycerol 3-phosphate transport system substrate-binding protein